MNWKLAGMAGTAVAVVALTGATATAGANKFTGNVSLAVAQSFEDDNFSSPGFTPFDDSFTSITGEGKINVAFQSNINLQLDFTGTGSFVDSNTTFLDRDASFQGSAHLYWRTDRFAAGAFAGGGVASNNFNNNAEYYFAGAEGQYYWKNFTFGLRGGYLDSSFDSFGRDDLYLNSAWFADAEVRWYASEKFALSAKLGYISGDAAFDALDVDIWHWGAKAEYWPEPKEPLSLWVAYEGRSTTADPTFSTVDFEKDVHTIKIGVTFHFGVDGTAEDNDRGGPAWNTQDYGDIVVGG